MINLDRDMITPSSKPKLLQLAHDFYQKYRLKGTPSSDNSSPNDEVHSKEYAPTITIEVDNDPAAWLNALNLTADIPRLAPPSPELQGVISLVGLDMEEEMRSILVIQALDASHQTIKAQQSNPDESKSVSLNIITERTANKSWKMANAVLSITMLGQTYGIEFAGDKVTVKQKDNQHSKEWNTIESNELKNATSIDISQLSNVFTLIPKIIHEPCIQRSIDGPLTCNILSKIN